MGPLEMSVVYDAGWGRGIQPDPYNGPRMMAARKIFVALPIAGLVALAATFTVRAALPTNATHSPAEAARLNAIGVALMNQQLTEKSAAKLAEAHAADPSSAIPVINRGIALLYLQKLPEAQHELEQATKMAANDP